MRILCVLLVCFVAVGYALPPRYYAVPEQIDDDDDADVQDSPYFSAEDDDMYTFPSGGPGGPPSNRFISDVGAPIRQARTETENQVSYLGKYYFDYDTNVLYQKDEGAGPLQPEVARQLLRMGEKKGAEEKQEEEDDDVVEDEEDQEDEEEDEDDQDDEPDYAVPDMSKLFPQNPQQSGKQSGPGVPPPVQGNRRYRYVAPTINSLSDLDDTVIVEADRPRILYDESSVEEDEDVEDDAEVYEDEADYTVPSFNTLFPEPGQKQGPTTNMFTGVASTWNSARPPGRYGRLVRLFQSPMHHDVYNPDYVVDPIIALNRRNERMKNRYSSPHWRRQNILTPYNYKPILYQQGHWGNPREHDYNPISGHHYVGGIYNGKTYRPQH